MPLVKEIVIEMALEQSVVMSHLTFFFLVAALVRFSPSHTVGRRLHDDDRRSGLLHGLPWQRVHNWACKNHLWPIRFLQGQVRRSSGLKRLDLWRDLAMQKSEICLVLAETENLRGGG
jgi:hypothetical protein